MLNDSNYSSRAKDVLIDFLIKAFSEERLYGNSNEYMWNPDPKQSRIFIADSNAQNMETVEQKTSIIVSRGNITWQGTTPDSMLGGNSFTGEKMFKDLLGVDMSINCFSREGLEAEFLGSLVFQLLRVCRQNIRETYDLHRIDVLGLSGESIVQGDSRLELSTVSVFTRLTWSEEWVTSREFLQLNKMDSILNVNKTDVKLPDTYDSYPIQSILLNPSRIVIQDASTNPALKPGQPVVIVGSTIGHDGAYHLGPIKGDTITLMQPLGGTEEETTTNAEIRIIIPGGSTTDGEITQVALSEDLTPPNKRPDISG